MSCRSSTAGAFRKMPGGSTPASQHFHRLGVVVEIVRPPVRDREGQCVAVPPPRAAGALQVVHRSRGDGAHDHGGEVADVHAKLQGRRGGEQVRLPGSHILSREPLLEMIAVGNVTRARCARPIRCGGSPLGRTSARPRWDARGHPSRIGPEPRDRGREHRARGRLRQRAPRAYATNSRHRRIAVSVVT